MIFPLFLQRFAHCLNGRTNHWVEDMRVNRFDEDIAARYDDDSEVFDPEVVDPVVDFLAGLAGKGRALELGIGTGRIALPLARKGVQVHGIHVSVWV